MINSLRIQSAYVDLYKQLRRYIWDFSTVEKLADLEVSVYKAFPSIEEVSKCFDKLRIDLKQSEKDDENLKTACDNFKSVLDSDTETYVKIYQVDEVIPL